MHPRTSSPVPSLVEERSDTGGPFLQARGLGREQVFRRATARWSHDAIADEAGQSTVVIGTTTADGFESRHGTSAVHDQHGRSALHAVDQRAEIVLGFRNTGLLHVARIA